MLRFVLIQTPIADLCEWKLLHGRLVALAREEKCAVTDTKRPFLLLSLLVDLRNRPCLHRIRSLSGLCRFRRRDEVGWIVIRRDWSLGLIYY